MKRFTKTLFIVLVAVAFVATGCKKESENTYKTVTLGAKIAQSNSKVYISGTYGTTPMWNADDVVKVNSQEILVQNVNGASAQLPGVTASNDGYYAYYPAGNVTDFSNGQFTVTLPAVQEYEETTDANSQTVQLVKAPMGAMTEGGSLTFHNLCSLLKVTVTAGESLKIREIKVTAGTTNLSGSTSITLSGEASDALTAPATGSKSVTLSFGNSGKTLEAGDHVFYIYLPAFTSQDVSVEVYNIGANNILGVKKKTFNGISVSANTINTVGTGSLTAESFTTTGAINGLFSVSADKKVRFSMGNLQTVFSNATTISSWQFASEQYGVIGGSGTNHGTSDYSDETTANNKIHSTTSNNLTETTSGTIIDLYTWVGASSTYSAYGIISNTNLANYGNTAGENLKADWGANNISNGGGANKWRTLTAEEWNYLLTNTNRSGMCYAKCTIKATNGYPGMIIFPDGFTAPSGITIYSANTANAPYTSNEFSAGDWSTLQNAGCVFLPAAGYRYSSSVRDVGASGNYWSSSAKDGDASSARYLNFSAGNVYPRGSEYRNDGQSVRLVQEY